MTNAERKANHSEVEYVRRCLLHFNSVAIAIFHVDWDPLGWISARKSISCSINWKDIFKISRKTDGELITETANSRHLPARNCFGLSLKVPKASEQLSVALSKAKMVYIPHAYSCILPLHVYRYLYLRLEKKRYQLPKYTLCLNSTYDGMRRLYWKWPWY